MEAAVKYINPENEGVKLAICFRGTKHAHCVMNFDTGISVVKVELRYYDKADFIKDGPGYYEVKKACKKFLALTKRDVARRTITERAKELLERALSGDVTEAELPATDAPAPKDEKPTTTSKEATKRIKSDDSKESHLARLCNELNMEPTKARRLLRAAGLHAPYDDAAALKKVLVR